MTSRGIRVAASFGTLCAGALVLAACTGKVLSLGTNSTQAQEVAPSAVSGTVPACPAGAAHPNVCCTAGPNQAGSCVVYPGAPFTQCDTGTTTYPDPRSCCPLDGSGNCASPPPSSSGGSGGSGSSSGGSAGGGCAYACPPGWYAPANASGNECCQTDSSGSTLCGASGGGAPGSSGSSGGSSGSGSGGTCGVCACPACPDDGGACPPCDCQPSAGCPTSCGSCPPGWQAPQGAPDLCCMTDSSGGIECFSQAVPPGQPPIATDAGPGPNPVGCSGSASTDGALGPCDCQEQAGGHTYDVSCDPGTNLCTCTVDNGGPSSSFADNGNTCGDSTALFTSCGFPH
jgi:hypothetical protein